MNNSKGVMWVLMRLFLAACLLLGWSHFALAQVSSASIVGRVEDSSGAGVPGAMVSITSLETGVARSVTADAEGGYRVLSLSVGRYDVKAEKAGFKVEIQSGIDLVVGQEAVVNLKLEVGQVEQKVTVTGEATLVNTTTESVSGLVGEKTVKDLPLNGRSFDQLLTLNAGASNVTQLKGLQVGSGGAGANQGQMFTVSGQRYGENLFLLNGVEYAGPSQNHSEPGGVSGQLLGVDAVREFNVETDTYGAQYGKRSGGQISIVTQSGTNQLHGTMFEFVRNSIFDARNYFDHPINGATGLPERIPPFKRNQFGAALGGPIQKDKTFVFGNYEGFRQRLGVSNTSIVPDNCSRNGKVAPTTSSATPYTLAQCLGAVANVVPGMIPIMDAYWPVPNGPELGGGTAQAFYNPLQSIREDFGTARVDHTFSDKDTLGVAYLADDGVSDTPVVDPLFKGIFGIRSQVLSLQETHIFSPNFINTFTAGLSRAGQYFVATSYNPIPTNLYFLLNQYPEPGRPSITAGNITSGGGSGFTHIAAARTLFTYQDGVQVVKGRHQISAGVTIEPLGSNEFSPPTGGATFASITTFLQGTVQNLTGAPIETHLHWRQLEGAWYVQDTIQVRHNLTVRLGLRHEFTNGWNEVYDRESNFEFGSNGVLLTNPVVGRSPYTQNNSKWLFGPRIGIAWDPFGNGKSSVRAGFGTYYSLIDTMIDWLDGEPPFNGSVSFANQQFLPLIPINSATPLPPTCGPGVPTPCTIYAPKNVQTTLKMPTVEEWNLTLEQQISPNSSIRLGYVGSHGFHNMAAGDPNSVLSQICTNAAGCLAGGTGAATARSTVAEGTRYVPVVPTLPNPYLSFAAGGYLEDISTSSYNALNAEFTRRFNAGLQFKAAYTWSKNMDIATGVTGGGDAGGQPLFDTSNPAGNYGPANDDQRQKFVFSGGYELPFGHNKPWLSGLNGVGEKLVSGWQVNTIVTAQSGFPFTVTQGTNRSGDGESGGTNPPSHNPAFTGSIITSSPSQWTSLNSPTWFNPSAFMLPAFGTFGNVQRDSLVGPDLRDVDVSLFKTTSVTERINVQFRAEAFNVFNRTNFGLPAAAISSGAGLITSAATSRQIQFGLKLNF
jgi:hypothetical protein